MLISRIFTGQTWRKTLLINYSLWMTWKLVIHSGVCGVQCGAVWRAGEQGCPSDRVEVWILHTPHNTKHLTSPWERPTGERFREQRLEGHRGHYPLFSSSCSFAAVTNKWNSYWYFSVRFFLWYFSFFRHLSFFFFFSLKYPVRTTFGVGYTFHIGYLLH